VERAQIASIAGVVHGAHLPSQTIRSLKQFLKITCLISLFMCVL